MKKVIYFLSAVFITTICLANKVCAQQYKIRQASSTMGMKSESTIYVKGKRKRTESTGMMGMSNPTVIEQCDKQRFIKINDKKKIYYIQPFVKETDEVIDEDVKPVPASKPKPVAASTIPEKGGVINMWYTITDTGERKKMYGLTARHVWTYQKMKPSADACYMKDSMIVRTDGWYIDLPEFNCPINYRPVSAGPTPVNQPVCKDRYVTRRKGKGKLGFALIEKRTMIMGSEGAKSSEYETSLETLEFSAAKLDSMLFEIPAGYTEVKTENELQEQFDFNAVIQDAKNSNTYNNNTTEVVADKTQKPTGMIRIGVYEPKGDGQLSLPALQRDLVSELTQGKVEAMAVSSEEEAKKFNCDYTLNTSFVKFKQASKIGGLIKAVKNTDPNAATSFNVETSLTLVTLADHSTKTQQSVNGKYEGKMDDAARKALSEGSQLVLRVLQ